MIKCAPYEATHAGTAARGVKLDRYPDIKPAFRSLADDVLVFDDDLRPAK